MTKCVPAKQRRTGAKDGRETHARCRCGGAGRGAKRGRSGPRSLAAKKGESPCGQSDGMSEGAAGGLMLCGAVAHLSTWWMVRAWGEQSMSNSSVRRGDDRGRVRRERVQASVVSCPSVPRLPAWTLPRPPTLRAKKLPRPNKTQWNLVPVAAPARLRAELDGSCAPRLDSRSPQCGRIIWLMHASEDCPSRASVNFYSEAAPSLQMSSRVQPPSLLS